MTMYEQVLDSVNNSLEYADLQCRGKSTAFPDNNPKLVTCDIHRYSVNLRNGQYEKMISLQEFKEKFLDNVSLIKSPNSINNTTRYILPPGVIYQSISGKGMTLICYYPERVTNIKYYDEDYTIPFPALLIRYSLTKQDNDFVLPGCNITYSVCCVPLPQINASKLSDDFGPRSLPELGILPFPNCYSDGRVCFGRNQMPDRFNNDFRGLNYYYQVMLDSPFNDDVGVRVDPSCKISTPSQLFSELSKKTTFPYDWILK